MAEKNKLRMDVHEVGLETIHPDPANARLHNTKNLDAIRASLSQHGQVEPLLVQKSSGKILGGNGRYEAMRAMGWTRAKVNYVDADDLHATALSLALNRTADLAEWDKDVLPRLVEEMDKSGAFDLSQMALAEEDLKALDCHVPDFGPDTDPPARLDEKKKVRCPECDHEFEP